MRIEIAIPRGGSTAGHALLAARLRKAGHAARAAFVAPGAPWTRDVAALFALENALYGAAPRDLFAPGEIGGPGFEGAPDVVVALDGEAASTNAPLLSPRFDGARDWNAAVSSLVARRAPEIAVAIARPDSSDRVLARGSPAIPFAFRVEESLNRVRARAIDLVVLAVSRLDAGEPGENPVGGAEIARSIVAAPLFGLAGAAGKIAARLNALATGARDSHWRVAWRAAAGDAVRETLRWPESPYVVLPDDGGRYYADPFPFAREGRTWLFVEEFPYATNKGVLSVCEMGPAGPLGAPRPILELGCHLSYPFVFERGGQVYLMPESVGENRLALYRATRFPDAWTLDRVLLADTPAADATLLERDGKLWLFASLSTDGQSDWDTLSIFHADALDGEWTALPENPAVIDARAARCAGRFFERDGGLFRPVQDCSRGYGSALSIRRVDRLDAGGFAQSEAAWLSPPRGFVGAHTLNDAGGFEAVDFLGKPGRRVGETVAFPAGG
jgi:hypothetical protein